MCIRDSAYFLPNAYVMPLVAAAMAAANVGGSMVGTWLALRYGSGLIRQIFLLVVGLLIVRFVWDTVVAL